MTNTGEKYITRRTFSSRSAGGKTPLYVVGVRGPGFREQDTFPVTALGFQQAKEYRDAMVSLRDGGGVTPPVDPLVEPTPPKRTTYLADGKILAPAPGVVQEESKPSD